jgi:hypothetical protein
MRRTTPAPCVSGHVHSPAGRSVRSRRKAPTIAAPRLTLTTYAPGELGTASYHLELPEGRCVYVAVTALPGRDGFLVVGSSSASAYETEVHRPTLEEAADAATDLVRELARPEAFS